MDNRRAATLDRDRSIELQREIAEFFGRLTTQELRYVRKCCEPEYVIEMERRGEIPYDKDLPA